jgi:hypothetical protein
MKKIAEVLVYLLSLYTLYEFTRDTLISEFGVKLTPSPYKFDGYVLLVGGFVLGIMLYMFKGRVNKIFATVMIIENIISLFIFLKYWN